MSTATVSPCVADPSQPWRGCQDFAFFRSEPASGDVVIEILDQEPDYDGLPISDASVYTPRNVVYRNGTVRYLDYQGRGIGICDSRRGGFRIQSRDPDLLCESVYLYLLSEIGQFLDRKRMHRVHALGVSIAGRAVLVLLPMGGGKSSLAMGLLKHPEVQLLSDDSPFIDSRGRIHAFPLRLGLLPGHEHEIPERHRRVMNRMEFGPKYLANFDYFAGRVCTAAEPGLVLLGHRSLSMDCRIERAGVAASLGAMISNSVVGLGLFQGLEFILSSSPLELLSKVRLGVSRLRNCIGLLRRSTTYHVYLGRCGETNARTIVEFSSRLFGRPTGQASE